MTQTMTDTVLDVVDRLTLEHPYRAVVEGRTRWVRREPLIAQLREAVAASLTGGNGTAATAGRLPFDADALEQYDRLEQLILDSLRDVAPATIPHLLPEQNLRAWYTAARPQLDADERATDLWHGVWSAWERLIDAKLTAPIVLELIDATTRQPIECPDCGMGWFEKILNSTTIPGSNPPRRWYDREKRVALTAIYRPDGTGGLERSKVECGCCGWSVTGTAIRGFAWDLEAADSRSARSMPARG